MSEFELMNIKTVPTCFNTHLLQSHSCLLDMLNHDYDSACT